MQQLDVSERVRGTLVCVFASLDVWCELPVEEIECRPDYPGAWSIGEHLEHVYLANRFLLLTIGKGCKKARRRRAAGEMPEGESNLELLRTIASPGAFEWEPPTHMFPTGRYDPAEIRQQLGSQLHECLRLLDDMPQGEGRLCSIRMSVHALGRLDMYQWLYFLAQHAAYHLNFIAQRSGAGPARGAAQGMNRKVHE